MDARKGADEDLAYPKPTEGVLATKEKHANLRNERSSQTAEAAAKNKKGSDFHCCGTSRARLRLEPTSEETTLASGTFAHPETGAFTVQLARLEWGKNRPKL